MQGVCFYILNQNQGCRHPLPMIAFLDIGQGDAIYIQDTLGKSILVDTGPKDSRVIQRIQKVTRCKTVHIDTLILTHPDADHIGEAERLVTKGLVHEVVHNGFMNINQGDETATENRLEALDILKTKVTAGDVLRLQDIGMEVLYPIDEPYVDDDIVNKKTKKSKPKKVDDNLYSIVMKVTSEDKTFLLTGDAPTSVEKKLIEKYGDKLESDVLKLGHHGSKHSSSQEFLFVVVPDEVVVSAGERNKYNHPNEEVLQKVEVLGRKKPVKVRATLGGGDVVYGL
jgi:competence protein ComEC